MTKRARVSKQRARAGMPLPILWTDRALSDLEAIGGYVARDDETAAERWVMKLIAAVERAATTPFAGRRLPELGRHDVRESLLSTYPIVCRVSSDRVEALTVFEGHRRFPGGSP